MSIATIFKESYRTVNSSQHMKLLYALVDRSLALKTYVYHLM